MRKILSVLVILAFVFSNSISAFASGGPDTWSATPASNDFNNASDWTAGSTNKPPALSGDSLVFATSSTTSLNNDLSGLSVTGITFNSGASTYNIGGDSITLTGAIQNNSNNNETISASIGGAITNSGAGNGSMILSGGINSNTSAITENSATSALNITGSFFNVTTGGTTVTDTAGTLLVTSGVTGAGNLILNNNTSTGDALSLTTGSVNNAGTVTNSGTGTGETLISGGVGSFVTGITENSATSALTISTNAVTVNSSGTTLTNSNASGSSLLTVSGGVSGTGNLILDNNSNITAGITLSGSSVDNTGTITNSGTGGGSTLISAAIGSAVTNVIENSTSISNLILTNGSNAQAATTVTAGLLQVQVNGALGTNSSTVSVTSNGILDLYGTNYSDTSALALSGALTNNSASAATYGGVITIGTGGAANIGGNYGNITLSSGLGTSSNAWSKTGTDTLTLDAASSFTGSTTISDGTLKVAANGALGTSAATVSVSGTGAALDLGGTNYATASALTIVGTGVSSNGALTNSGGTATYGGVLTIGSGGASIGGAGNIILSGGLGSSANALDKVSADSLILTTSNSNYSGNITIGAGTLFVGNGSTTGGLGSGNVIDNATLAFDNNGSSTALNAISGTGALIQEGTGAITLSGANSYAGTTTINSGATVIAGSNSALGTGAGGVTNNGTLNIGAQSLNLSSGSSTYTQASGSTLDLTANSASSYGSISPHSASVLANNTINVTVDGYIPNKSVLSIIDPFISITGVAPTTVTSTSSFINFVSSIAGGDLILTANTSSTNFSSVAGNPNATAVGNVLDNETNPSSDLGNILYMLESSSSAQVSATLNTLTPVVDRGVIDSSMASLNNFVGAAFQRTRDVLAFASSGNSDSTGVSAGDASLVNGLWAKQYGGYEDEGNREGIAGYNAWNTGTTVGLDRLLTDNFTAGASLGYGYGRVNSADGASTDINSAQCVIYAGYQGTDHPYYVDVAGTVAENWYNGQRDITIDTMNRIADAAYRGTQSGVYLESGYNLNPWNSLQVTPLASLQYTYLRLNSYDESNAGDLDLNVNSQGYNTLESGLGASIAYPVKYAWGSLTPEFHAKWLYDFIDQDMSVTSAFSGGGASFTTNGAAPARDAADIGGKLTFNLKNDVSVVGEVDTEIRDNFFGIFGSISVQYKF